MQTILHADLDAFYASVEQRDRPELRGKPVVVGGPPEHRGVVAAASYEARRFGVHSAMPMSTALRLCPTALRVSPRFDRYREVSRVIMSLFRDFTPLVEPLSLDEAFLDVSDRVAAGADRETLGRELKQIVKGATGLHVSIGIGSNKTVAKIASDARKPDGLVVVPPGEEAAFLAPFPARALWGVGPRAEEALRGLGIITVGDIAKAAAKTLEAALGSRGPYLQQLARGEDGRPVEPHRERKSVGAETTFSTDIPDGPELRAQLSRLVEEVAGYLNARGLQAGTATLKLRYANFTTISRQVSWQRPTDDLATIQSAAAQLLTRIARPADRFRLVGVQCSRLSRKGEGQLPLW